MKKIILVISTLLIGFTVAAQENNSTISEVGGQQGNGSGSRAIVCPDNTVYEHIINYANGFTASNEYTVYDQFVSAPGTISEIVVYGIPGSDPDRNFNIKFYDDNAGIPGTQYATYSSFIEGTNTGELLFGTFDIYSYSFIIPGGLTVDADDWVSIHVDGTSPWYWCTASGGDGCVIQEGGPGKRCDFGDVAMCLVGETEGVPLSDYAIYFSIFLILAFTAIRFRRVFI